MGTQVKYWHEWNTTANISSEEGLGPSAKMRVPKIQKQKYQNIPPEGQKPERWKYESTKKIMLYFNQFIKLKDCL